MKQAGNVTNLLKRGLLLGLVLCLAVPSIPGLSLTAKAAAYSGITTNTTLSNGDTISGTVSSCTVTIPAGAAVTVTGQIAISGTVNVVGGGKLIRGSSFTSASMILVNSGATLNIGTSVLNGVTIDGNSMTVGVNGGGIYVDGGILNLNNGATVSNHYISKSEGMGGGIYVNSGTLNMYSGALVKDNESTVTSKNGGGGIAIYEGAYFYMYGGTISGNKAPSTAPGTGGGGVYCRGNFTLSDGTISNNTTGRNGGAVHLDGGDFTTASPVMTMTGGLITGNYSTSWAGGIEILSKSGLAISGGKINSNSCGSGGGGIELDAVQGSDKGGYLQVSGGAQITGNTRGSLQDDVYIDKNIAVTGNFTGSIGITHENSSVNAIGGVFGSNNGSYTGMQNFFCDEKKYVGELYGTSVRWKSCTTALTGVTLSTYTPVTGTAITTALVPSGGSATYQWYRNTSSLNSNGTLIVGATGSSYTPMSDDVGKYLYVVANGTGGSTGRVVSPATTKAVQWGSVVATPSFSVAAGTYADEQSVAISCATEGAAIYYTTNGSTPTSGSTEYTGPITVSSTQTIKAIAVKTECGNSSVSSATYTILDISATPYTGTYDGSAHDAVTVSGTLAGDTITYSTDGTNFSSTCPQYTDAGSYPVYVKAVSASYADWESGLKTVAISRATGSISITGDPSKTYDGSTVSDPALTKIGNGTVSYSYYSDSSGSIGTKLSGAPSNTGTYWVKAVMAESTNYTSAEASRRFTISAPLGELTSSVTKSGFANVNLTDQGDMDWAVWGYSNSGMSTSLAPDVSMAGGTGISNLTDIDPGTDDALRGLGQFRINHTFSWTNGSGTTSATNVYGGLQHNVAATYETGDGFSFTVPADTTKKRLIVYTAVHYAVGELTATLSDGSAAPLTLQQDSKYNSNDPSRFIIDYSAGSSGQTLTIKFVVTWNNNDGNGNAQIYAAALSNYHTATINVLKDGVPVDASGSVELRQGGSTVAAATSDGETGVYKALVLNGKYDVYIGGVDTGADITINAADNSADVNCYTVNYGISDTGKASGSTISAMAGGSAITSGTAVFSGKTVVITALGAAADSYAYAWTGTGIDGANGKNTASMTIAALNGKVDATCTVAGTLTGTISIMGDPSKTYDGSAVKDSAVTKNGTGAVTYSYYTDNSGVIGTSLSGAPSAAGTYWVKAEMAQDTNYTSAGDTKKFTINRAAGSITITCDPSKTYDGSAVTDPAVNKNGTGAVTYIYYNDNAGAISTALVGAPSAVGVYWVKAVMAEDTNYTGAEVSKQFSITAVNISGITTTPYIGTYDGTAHDAVTVTGTLAGDTITYSTDGTTFLSTCPKYNDAGSYSVYVKVARSGCVDWESGLTTAVISRAAGSVTISGDPSKTYDGSAVADPAVNKKGTGAVTYTYYSDNAGAIGTAIPKAPSAVGTYWVKAVMAQDTNYSGAEATKQFTIQNENVSGITVSPYAGTFDGKAHNAAEVIGTQAGDTVSYSMDGATFTETCPQYTNAGSYSVYVKVARAGCTDWESGQKTVVISRMAGTIAITGDPSKTYDGKAVTDPAVNKNGTGAVTYTYYGDNAGVMGTALTDVPSAVGTYWVKAVMAQDTNYAQAETIRQFSIEGIICYKVAYNPNTATGGSVPADSRLYEKDSTVTILGNTGNLSKKGYTFIGWNTNSDGKGIFYKSGDTFGIYCDTTLYAVWQINSYKVRFEDWDGSLIKEETVHYGSTASAPADPERTGYTFSGWDHAYSFISGDITVTAQYKINTYTVRFSTNGGSNVPDQTVAYLGSATQPAEPSMSGYTFAGWFLDSALRTPYDPDMQVKNDITLYAKWTENAAFVQRIAQGLTIESAFKFAEGDIWECVTSDFMILNSKMTGVQIEWSSSDESAVHIENGGEKATGVVSRPKDRDVSVVITAAISKDGTTAKKTFLLIIKRKDASKNETRIPTERTASVQAGQDTEGETIYRTVLNDNTNIDTVIITTEKVKKLMEKSNENGTVSVSIGRYDNDPANEFAFEVSTDVVSALTEKGLGLTLNSPEGSVTLSTDTLKQAAKSGMELYFRIVPVAGEQTEVQNDFNHDGTILSLMNAGTKKVLGVPRVIETNMEGYLTTVQLPLNDIDQSKLADPKFLSSLCIYVEHGDGTTELITGKIIYNGAIPCAIEFKISNFSRFQIVSIEPASPWVTIGVCIGGAVILIILIIIMIYRIRKNKSKQEKQVY